MASNVHVCAGEVERGKRKRERSFSQDAGKNTTTRTDEREKGNLNLETKEPETRSSGSGGGIAAASLLQPKTFFFFRVAFPPFFPTEISQTQRIYDPFSGR